MTNSASTLIVPVESQVRELDAKLLLSCVAAERGKEHAQPEQLNVYNST